MAPMVIRFTTSLGISPIVTSMKSTHESVLSKDSVAISAYIVDVDGRGSHRGGGGSKIHRAQCRTNQRYISMISMA